MDITHNEDEDEDTTQPEDNAAERAAGIEGRHRREEITRNFF